MQQDKRFFFFLSSHFRVRRKGGKGKTAVQCPRYLAQIHRPIRGIAYLDFSANATDKRKCKPDDSPLFFFYVCVLAFHLSLYLFYIPFFPFALRDFTSLLIFVSFSTFLFLISHTYQVFQSHAINMDHLSSTYFKFSSRTVRDTRQC